MANASKKPPATRVQYGALPYRRRKTFRTEVMLVTSRETGRWVIPKGWPKRRKAPYASAAREAFEEAGVVGKVGRFPIGSYSYKKRLKQGKVVVCRVEVFALEVKRLKKSWPEQAEREVQWFSPTEAAETVSEPELSDIIRNLPKRLVQVATRD
jgi:8-oxo-dGTP pyrophosphatase MutT (NUDIX family)